MMTSYTIGVGLGSILMCVCGDCSVRRLYKCVPGRVRNTGEKRGAGEGVEINRGYPSAGGGSDGDGSAGGGSAGGGSAGGGSAGGGSAGGKSLHLQSRRQIVTPGETNNLCYVRGIHVVSKLFPRCIHVTCTLRTW